VAGVRVASLEHERPVEYCTLEDALTLPGFLGTWDDASLESIVALMFTGQGEADSPAVTYLDLPAGRVARIDFSVDESYRSTYVLPRGKTIHMVVCEGPERPGKDWDPIAGSIELLPAKE
jgi:hypothetical protein